MAKSKSFFGLRRGSTKSHTYQVYRGQQITKDRVDSVANPQTSAQMHQRLKLAMLAAARAVLKGLVDHSFEGVTYGRDSLKYFMQANLGKDGMTNILAYIPKGAADTGLADYVVSKGSLVYNEVTIETAKAGNKMTAAEIGNTADNASITAVAAGEEIPEALANVISSAILKPTAEGNQANTQLTFLVGYLGQKYEFATGKDATGDAYYHRYIVSRWIGDYSKQKGVWTAKKAIEAADFSSDTATRPTITITDGFLDLEINLQTGTINVSCADATRAIVCGTIISSEKVNDTWKRSSQQFELAEYGDDIIASDQYEDVIYSYLKTAASTDKYLNSGTEGVGITGSN